MNEKISLFIDDEMGLDEKIFFVKEIRKNPVFASETIELLRFEKQIRADVVERLPGMEPMRLSVLKKVSGIFMQPLGWTASALAVAIIALILTTVPSSGPVLKQNRFVIYLPDVNQVEIAGSFTSWKRIPMQRAGDSGYWEVHLALPEGEHQFTYIVDGRQRLADPTIQTREQDDFGGYNSILFVEDQA